MTRAAEMGASAARKRPNTDIQSFPGTIQLEGVDYPVTLRFASKYSLWLSYTDTKPPVTEGLFDQLTIRVKTRVIETGGCQVTLEQINGTTAYRVIAREGIHDLQKLLFNNKVDILDNTPRNLPLILGYKNNIDPTFRELVSDTCYDLSVYRDLFDRLDEEYGAEPEHVAETIQKSIIEQLGPDLCNTMDVHIERIGDSAAQLQPDRHGNHGYYLRKQLWTELIRVPVIARTNLKPRGYVGDSEMMKMCYRNDFEGEGSFSRILHKYAVSTNAAQAVRNRRQLLPAIARSLAEQWSLSKQQPFRILSVACGPAVELNDLFLEPQDSERFHCSLLDQDTEALAEARETVSALEATLGTTLPTTYFQESVRTLLSTRELRAHWGDFHFIYSMGLFDYLTPPVAEAVLRKLYALLLPGADMVIGNFHEDNPNRHFMDYWLDWPLYYRTEKEFLELAEGLPGSKCWVEYDSTGIQMLLRIKKASI